MQHPDMRSRADIQFLSDIQFMLSLSLKDESSYLKSLQHRDISSADDQFLLSLDTPDIIVIEDDPITTPSSPSPSPQQHTCSICLDTIVPADASAPICGCSIYHTHCLHELMKYNKKCPACRTPNVEQPRIKKSKKKVGSARPVKQTTRKYTRRKSPPFKSRDCLNSTPKRKGNDGRWWIAKRTWSGARWCLYR